jgi:hypothetical protein
MLGIVARWEDDDRGQGVASADQLVAGVSELVAAFREPAWVAEHPEAHLLPHVQAWTAQDARLALTGARTDAAGAYVLEFEWRGATAGVGDTRAAVFALVGSFAEGATYIRQRRVAREAGCSATKLRFEIGTGELAPDTHFDPHGHVVLIDVTGVL